MFGELCVRIAFSLKSRHRTYVNVANDSKIHLKLDGPYSRVVGFSPEQHLVYR